MVALGDDGLASFPGLVNALAQQQTDRLVYFVFDLLFAERKDIRERPLVERKMLLEQLLQSRPASSAIRYVEHFPAKDRAQAIPASAGLR